MARTNRVNWLRLLSRVGRVLSPVVSALTVLLRDELEESLHRFYSKALQTENPWDDFLGALLLEMLGFDVPDDEE